MTSAHDLTARLADLLRREHAALAEFLVALADFDAQRRWLELGYASLFYFLHRELGLSKSAAFQRMTAAQLIQKYPEIVEPLRDGRLCLSTVSEVSKVVTPENRSEVLARYFHLSKREAMAVSAELRPCEAAPHRVVVTAVRAPARLPLTPAPSPPALAGGEGSRERGCGAPGQGSREADLVVRPEEPAAPSIASRPPEGPPAPPRPPTQVAPPTPALSRLHVTVSRRFLEKPAAVKAALSHSQPGASEEELLEAGLDLLLERHAKRRGLVDKPRREPPPAKPEHVPAHVKRAVWARDGGRCQWPTHGGGVCGSTHQVELDHIVPRAKGGPSTVANLRLTCRVHNDLAAREVYGDAWMDRFTRGGARPSPEKPLSR